MPSSARKPSLGGRWLRREAEQTDEGMEHSSKCDAIRYCSPTLIRLAPLGTFHKGEGIRCGGDFSPSLREAQTAPSTKRGPLGDSMKL